MTDSPLPAERARVQIVALLFALSILLIAVFGFIPGITMQYGDMSFAGDDSRAQLFGAFQVSVLLNLVHLLIGIAGIPMAQTWEGARTFLIGGGILFVGLWLLGVLGGADWIPTNSADNWLHAGVGVAMIALGVVFATGRGGRARAPTRPA